MTSQFEARQIIEDEQMREALYSFLWEQTHKPKVINGKEIPAEPMPDVTIITKGAGISSESHIKKELKRILGISRWPF